MPRNLRARTFAVACVAAAAAAVAVAPAADAAQTPASAAIVIGPYPIPVPLPLPNPIPQPLPLPNPIPEPLPFPTTVTCTTSVSGATGTAKCGGTGEVVFVVSCSAGFDQAQFANINLFGTLSLTCASGKALAASATQVHLIG